MADPIETAARYAAAARRDHLPPEAVAELAAAVQVGADARVRTAALAALVRAGDVTDATWAWETAARDPDAAVRRRVAELAPGLPGAPGRRAGVLLDLLADPDPFVAETAAWALGEIGWPEGARARVVAALGAATGEHPDPLVREAAVAALGAIGDPAGLEAVLRACGDRPAIRRRAVLALAPFDGPAVDAALAAALDDPDWQVRQAAEDLTCGGGP